MHERVAKMQPWGIWRLTAEGEVQCGACNFRATAEERKVDAKQAAAVKQAWQSCTHGLVKLGPKQKPTWVCLSCGLLSDTPPVAMKGRIITENAKRLVL